MQNKQNKRRVVWHSLECAVRVTACSCPTAVDVVHLLAIVTSVTDALKHTRRSGIGQCDAEGYLQPCVGHVVLVPNCSRCCAHFPGERVAHLFVAMLLHCPGARF